MVHELRILIIMAGSILLPTFLLMFIFDIQFQRDMKKFNDLIEEDEDIKLIYLDNGIWLRKRGKD